MAKRGGQEQHERVRTTPPEAVLLELPPMLSAQSAELSRRLGRAPTATEVAGALGIDHSDVVDVLVTSSARHGRHVDSGADPKEAPAMAHNLSQWDAKLECIEDCAALRPVLAELPEEERSAVMLRIFGSLSQTQIAELLGLSPMYVSRLLTTALTKLRNGLQDPAAKTQLG